MHRKPILRANKGVERELNMTEYERMKVREMISGMTEEEKEIAREVLAEEENRS